MSDELYKLPSVHHSSFGVHRLLERFYLGEVAGLVGADEEEPLVEVERAPDGVREAERVAVGALDAWAQRVERRARVAQTRQRVGQHGRVAGADALGRFELDGAAALDELLDGDRGEGRALGARRARLFGLAEQLAEEPDDVTLDYREVLAELRRGPPVRRGAEALLLLAQVLDRAEQALARRVDVVEDFADAVKAHKGKSLLSAGVV